MMTSDPPSPELCPETTSGSLLHWLAGDRGPGSPPPRLVRAYLVTISVTFLPLFVAAALDPHRLWYTDDPKHLTFLHDWGLLFALVVSFPTLVLLLISDEQVLSRSLKQEQDDEVIAVEPGDAVALTTTWARTFRRWNIGSQIAGAVLGIGLGLATLQPYLQATVDSWIAPGGHLGLPGYLYGYCITLIYALVIVYVTRCCVVSWFLRDLVSVAPLRLLPFHPDKCGGLRPVGRLGLRNQYTLTILGINIVLLVVVWKYFMHEEASLRGVLIGASLAYFVLGPIVFMVPLLPFRAGMLRAKARWTSEVARLLRGEFERLRGKIQAGEIGKLDEESIDRLRKLGAVVDELPVWPFDAHTLRRFATAYLVPVGLSLLGKAALGLLAGFRF